MNDLGENLLRFKKDQKFLLYDTESCSLNLQGHRNVPWEYAWILCTQKEELERKEYLVQWDEIPIGAKAAQMTGFWSKQHKIPTEGKSPEFVLAEFEKHLYDPDVIPIAHNGLGFDIYMHRIHRLKCGKASDYSYMNRFIDTNCIARARKLDIKPPAENRLAWQYQLLGYRERGMKTSIKALAEEYGLGYDESRAHAALYDVELLKGLFFKLLYEVEI